MKIISPTFALISILCLSFSKTFASPYSTNNQIQIYSEVPDSFLSTGAKKCIESFKKKGVMSQLSNNLGCSNFVTAKDVCGCVDKAFDKNKVEEFIASDEVSILSSLMDEEQSLDEDKLKPSSELIRRASALNNIYDKMGLSGCSMDESDPYVKKIKNNYIRLSEENAKESKVSNKVRNHQHFLFNVKLKSLGRAPTREELVEISSLVTSESGEVFFLDDELADVYLDDNENSQVYSDIHNTIINDYVQIHLNELKNGVPPEEFKIQPIKRQGCKQLMSFVSLLKERTFDKKIESNFSTFFPESFINKGKNSLERKEKRSIVETAISNLDDIFAMSGTPEYKKDIFYCSKYNEFKKRSEEMSKNEEFKLAIAELENLKEEVLGGIIASSGSSANPMVQDVRDRITALENNIKEKYDLSDDALRYAYMGLKIWKVDKGVNSVVGDDGVITFHDNSLTNKTQSLREQLAEKINKMDRSARLYSKKYNIEKRDTSSLIVAKPIRTNSAIKNFTKVEPKVSSYSPAPEVNTSVNKDNYFNRRAVASNYKPETQQYKSNVNSVQSSQALKSRQSQIEDPLDSYISDRLSKLKEEKVNTEKALSDELASTKESLELAKLREELRKQSAEIKALTSKSEESPSVTEASTVSVDSSPVNFKSPLANALNNTFIDNTSEDTAIRQVEEGGTARNVASAASFTPGVDQVTSSSGGGGSSATTVGSAISLTEETSSVSGISLSSLKTIGDDVQVIDNSVLGEIRPIVVDASFDELSEDEKREKIEELLETTVDDEVYIEFPDGKVLKFSKKDELGKLKKPQEVAKKKEEDIKKRDTFSYDKLKEIIDNTKE